MPLCPADFGNVEVVKVEIVKPKPKPKPKRARKPRKKTTKVKSNGKTRPVAGGK